MAVDAENFDFESLGAKLTKTITDSFDEAMQSIDLNQLAPSFTSAIKKVDLGKIIVDFTKEGRVQAAMRIVEKKLKENFKDIKFEVGEMVLPNLPTQVIKATIDVSGLDLPKTQTIRLQADTSEFKMPDVPKTQTIGLQADTSDFKMPDVPKSLTVKVQTDVSEAQKQLDTFSTSQEPITVVTQAVQESKTIVETSSFEQAGDLVSRLVALQIEANKKLEITAKLYNDIYTVAMKIVEAKRMEQGEVDKLMSSLHQKVKPSELHLITTVDDSKVREVAETPLNVNANINTQGLDFTGLELSIDRILKKLKNTLKDILDNVNTNKLDIASDKISRLGRKSKFDIEVDDSILDFEDKVLVGKKNIQAIIRQIADDEEKSLNLEITRQRSLTQNIGYLQEQADVSKNLLELDRAKLVELAHELGVSKARVYGEEQLRKIIVDTITKRMRVNDLLNEETLKAATLSETFNDIDTSRLTNELSLQLNLTDKSIAALAATMALQNQQLTGKKALTAEQITELKIQDQLLQDTNNQLAASDQLLQTRLQITDTLKKASLDTQVQQQTNLLGLVSDEAKARVQAILQQKIANGEAAKLNYQEMQSVQATDNKVVAANKLLEALTRIGTVQKEVNNLAEQSAFDIQTAEITNQLGLTEELAMQQAKAIIQKKVANGEAARLSQIEIDQLQAQNNVAKATRETLQARQAVTQATSEMNKELQNGEMLSNALGSNAYRELGLTQQASKAKAQAIILDGIRRGLSQDEIRNLLQGIKLEDEKLKRVQANITASNQIEEASQAIAQSLEDQKLLADALESSSYTELGLTQEITRAKAQAVVIDGLRRGLSQDQINLSLQAIKSEDILTERLQRRIDASKALQSATDEYAKAMRQTESDIKIKSLIVGLRLTEDETSQLALQMAIKNEQLAAEGKLTDELIAQMKLNNGLTNAQVIEIKNKNTSLRQGRETVELIEHVANYQREINEEVNKLTMGYKKLGATMKAILTDPKLAKGVLVASIIQGMNRAKESVKDFQEVGMTAGEAVGASFRSFSLMSVAGLDKSSDVLKSMASEYGSLNRMSDDQLHTVGQMASKYNLAGDEALKLTMAVSRMPGQSMETAKNFGQTAERIGKMKGVLPSQIMRDMAKNTENMAKYSKGGAENFAKAAASARKMGIEIGDALSAAEKTLDIESSLNAQMEASAMLGKEINLDRLRYAALNGNASDVLREQQAIMGQIGDFDNLSLLKKQALANAMGMSVEQIQKMNEEARFQSKYFGENASSFDNFLGKLSRGYDGLVNLGSSFGPAILGMIGMINQYRMLNLMKEQNAILTGRENIQNNANSGGIIRNTAAKLSNFFASVRERIAKFLGIQTTVSETITTDANTGAKYRNAGATRAAGMAAKGAASGMLAFGGAILMIGGGIAVAALGLAELVKSFKGLTGGEIAGALLGLSIVMGGFVGIIYAMIPAIAALGAVSAPVAVPLLALGAAMLMLGAGVGLAAYGMSMLVESFKGLDLAQITGAAVGMISLGAAFYFMVPALTAFATTAGVAVGPLLGLGVALLMMGGAIALAAYGLSILVGSFKELKPEIAMSAAFAIGAFALAIWGMIPALTALATTGPIAIPAMQALGITALLVGAGFMMMGLGLEKTTTSVMQLVGQIRQLPELTSGLLQLSVGLDKVSESLRGLGRAGLLAVPAMTAIRTLSVIAPTLGGGAETGRQTTAPATVTAAPPTTSAIPAAPTAAPVVAQTTTASQTKMSSEAEVNMKALVDKLDNFLTVFRKKDITLLIDGKVLHKELFDGNYGGKTGTNRV